MPGFNQKKLPLYFGQAGALHLLLLVAVVGILGFILFSSNAPIKDKLLSSIFPKPASHAALDYYGRTVTTFGLFGQKDIGSATRQSVTPNAAYHGSGVIVDTSSTPNKIYFVDSGNNRILGFNGGDGTAKPADLVIGQPSMNVGNCNGDSNIGFKKSPTASTLCLTFYPFGANTAEQWGAYNIDVDSQGNLYIPDKYNNRILEYYQPFSTDKTNGKGDGVADFVYGQPDFTSNKPNGGDYSLAIKNPPVLNPATSNLLDLCCGYNAPTATSVSVDPSDNGVWVADSYNGRVMHFPHGNKNPDITLGQKGCDNTFADTSTMCNPIAARINPDTKELYVIDNWQGFEARFMVFNANSNDRIQNGQAASRIFKPNVPHQAGVNDSMFDSNGSYIFRSSGFVFNKDKTDYPTGLIWINEHEKGRALLLKENGDVVIAVNSKDVYHNGWDAGYSGCDHNVYEGNRLMWPSGSIGQDSSNNIYFADEFTGRVIRYSLPYTTYQYNGTNCPPEGDASLLQRGWNVFSMDTLGESRGVVTYGNQLIVGDQNLNYKVWNDYKNKAFGTPADYTLDDRPRPSFFSGGIDDSGRLWTQHEQGVLEIWQLPITTNNQPPLKSFWQNHAAVPIYWADDQSVVSGGNWGVWAFDPVGKAMYVVQGARVLRIKNYNDFNNKLYVDMVIGQTNKTSNNCNQGLSAPNAGTLCETEQIKFDKLGNLYVIDNTYECHGNRRITVFMADDLKNASGLFPNLQAKKVFNSPDFTSTPNCAYWVTDSPGSPVTLAFNSLNQLVIGNDGAYGDNSQRELKQLWFYANPLNKQTPDASIKLYTGVPGDITFDDKDNLLVNDGTWYRVSMINLCTDPSWLEWLPGVTPVSACIAPSSPSPTPSPTPVPVTSKRVFVTSNINTGNLGGLVGADQICQTTADNTNLGGSWKAWISSSTVSVNDRFAKSTLPYVLLNGNIVANNWTDLTDGSIKNFISVDESKNTVTSGFAWTNTAYNGKRISISNGNTCSDWTSAATAKYTTSGSFKGYNLFGSWTMNSPFSDCSKQQGRLYCFEQ